MLDIQRLIVVVFLMAFTTLSSCGYFLGVTVSEEIPDLTKPWEKVMKVELAEGQYVHRVKVEISGQSSGKFSLNGKEFEPGGINAIVRDGDFYGTDFSVSYKPIEENKGELKVHVTYYYSD